MDQLLPFALFAFVASITPGPTNILVLSHSSRFGLATTVPIILGACAAAAFAGAFGRHRVGRRAGAPCHDSDTALMGGHRLVELDGLADFQRTRPRPSTRTVPSKARGWAGRGCRVAVE